MDMPSAMPIYADRPISAFARLDGVVWHIPDAVMAYVVMAQVVTGLGGVVRHIPYIVMAYIFMGLGGVVRHTPCRVMAYIAIAYPVMGPGGVLRHIQQSRQDGRRRD